MTGEFSVAAHALVYLYHKGGTIPSAELADNICANPARVRKVMSRLVRAGLAVSSEGRGSGYAAVSAGGEITLLQVMDALGCRAVDTAWRTGDMDRECLVSSGMGDYMDGLCEELNGLCRERLGKVTVGMIADGLTKQKGK